MASHRAPKVTSRAAALSLVGVAAGAVALIPSTSQADPAPSLDQAKADVANLNAQMDKATDAYDAAETTYTTLQAKAAALQNDIAQEQQQLQALQSSMGLQAAAQYRSSGVSPSLQLALTASPDTYLTQASANNQAESLEALKLKMMAQDKAELKAEQDNANSAEAQAQSALNQASQSKQQIQDELNQKQSVLDSLTAQQAAQITAGNGTTSYSGTLPTPSGRAAAAVAYAEAAVGDPYVYGASGPDSFDCSGLTMASWAAAGVTIPRTSEDQYDNADGDISIFDDASQLEPGDLVFFEGVPPGHVAIYVGNDMIIHAPTTGQDVQYASLDPSSSNYIYLTPVGYGRVDG
ncbi:MAG TPA: NlpC/P60 family protein [Actinocrinis sp.]|jgi:cell wall-associated NlpC family hydrolase